MSIIERICDGCGCKIEKGEKYYCIKGLEEDYCKNCVYANVNYD
jgi:hypothetical protein